MVWTWTITACDCTGGSRAMSACVEAAAAAPRRLPCGDRPPGARPAAGATYPAPSRIFFSVPRLRRLARAC